MARKHRIIPPLTPQDLIRFRSKVRIGKPDECWLWTAYKTQDGYGWFHLGSETDGSGEAFGAHRVAWTIANKRPIPLGMCVCHHCDRPPCQNPRHLFLATHIGNMHDRKQKGRNNPQHGEQSGTAVLAEQDVRDIRRRCAAGESQIVLAREYDVRHGTIWFIVHHKTWAHVS